MASFMWMVNSASDLLALLGESSLRAAVLLGAAWAACWLLRRRSAALRHLIWAALLAALVIGPVSLDLAPKLRIPAWWQPAVQPAAGAEDLYRPELATAPAAVPDARWRGNDAAPLSLNQGVNRLESLSAAPRATPPPSPAPPREIRPALLLAAWALGFAAFAARLGIGHLRVRQAALRATALDSVAELACGWQGRRPVRFLQSAGETMPMTWGWSKPVVLLPASFINWDRERQAMTIHHELAHIRRADWLTQTLAQLAGAVYWFHPLVWFALRRMRIEADRACDDMVLRAGVKPSGYAGHLVQSAREFRTAGLRPWVAIAMAHPSSLNHRVHYVLDSKVVRSGLGRRRGLALAVGIALIVLLVPSIEAVGQAGPASTALATGAAIAAPAITAPASTAPRVARNASAVQSAEAAQQRISAAFEQDAEAAAQELMLLAQAQQPEPQGQAAAPQPRKSLNSDRLSTNVLRLHAAKAKLAAQLQSSDLRDKFAGIEGRKRSSLSPESMQAAGAALRKALGSSDAKVRAEAAEALGRLGSPEEANLQALAAALSDSEPSVQRNAVESLGRLLRLNKELPADDAVRWLEPALTSADPGLRREAAEALGRLRGAAVIDAATRLVGDADPQVQREAIESLGRLLHSADAQAAKAALPALQNAMQHDDPNVRRQLVETLGGLRAIADEVVPLLAKAAEDPDPAVQREAVEALGRISSGGGGFADWIGHWDGEIEQFHDIETEVKLDRRLEEAHDAIVHVEP
jgi:beta-lactamase regulating signal transducer with metallopeptidase domain